jgi:hypothetical protein
MPSLTMASLAGTHYSGSRIKILFGMIVYKRCAEIFSLHVYGTINAACTINVGFAKR